MLKIQRIKCGNGNCYIVSNGENAILVDTCREKYRDKILDACKPYRMRLLLLTHGHVDHVENAAYISKELDVPIAICELDKDLIKDNMLQPLYAKTLTGKLVLSLSEKAFHHDKIPQFTSNIFLKEGDSLKDYGINAKIIALPGHTNGSIGIDLGKDGVIVGDALMNMFYPTVSMLYHDYEKVIDSANRISSLGERVVYFGHGKPKKNRRWAK